MKIVIVGGGFGGVKTALELSNKEGLEVTLISQGPDFEYHGALYRSATGHSPLEVVLRIGELLEHARNVTFVVDKITAINTKVKAVRSDTGQIYQYDKLILCMGNEKNFFGISGLDTYAHTMYTIHDTMQLRQDLVHLFSQQHRKAVRIIVIGAGPTGVELAGELQNFARLVADRYGVEPKQVGVDLIEGSNRVLPTLDQKASVKALRRLKKIGVNVLLEQKVLSCSQNAVKLEHEERAADIIVWTAGSKAVDIYAKYPEVFELERGKVKVDEYLRVPKAPDVFVMGDNAFTQYSGMAQTAINDAIFVSNTILSTQAGREAISYKPKQPIYVVPISGKWAVVQIKGKVRSGRYGWSIRRKADLYIFKNFEPLKKAYKTWRKGNEVAHF